MSLVAVVVDPLAEPVPAAWDAFVTTHALLPMWRAELVSAAGWCAPAPSSLVLVADARSDDPIALFHASHVGPRHPSRFVEPGHLPRVRLTDCRLAASSHSTGMAFAPAAGPADRSEAVRVYERAIRRHRAGAVALAYRELRDEDLAVIPTAHRLRLRLHPRMVLTNEWSDITGYLGTLPGKWRSQLKKIHYTVRTDETIHAGFVDGIDTAEACWLAEVVRMRHRARGLPQPPLPALYLQRLIARPEIRLLAYRDDGGRLLAYTLFHDDGSQLVLISWGSRAGGDGQRRDLYFDQYRRLIELMITTGRERLVLGKGMTEIKARYGARPVPLWGVVGAW